MSESSKQSKQQQQQQQKLEENNEDIGDSLKAFQLRFRFQDHSFTGRIWRALRDSGWTHEAHSRTYKSPTGRVFESSSLITQYLDLHAIADIHGNLDYPEEDVECGKSRIEWTCDDREQAWTHRQQALTEIWKRGQQRETGKVEGEKDDSDATSDSENDQQQGDKEDETVARRSSRRRSQRVTTINTQAANTTATSSLKTNQYKSVTMTEKGTDLYLGKNSSKGRFKKRRAPTDAVPVSTESLTTPSVDACRQQLREQSRHNTVDHKYQEQFAKWRWLLSTNHSLLFYGAGSKFHLLNAFADEELGKEGYVLVLNGFDKDISIESILDLMVRLFLDDVHNVNESRSRIPHLDGNEGVTATGTYTPWKAEPIVERAIQLGRALAEKCGETLIPIFLVIHTLEGLGNRIAQQALSTLLVNSVVANGVASVRLVASVDHVDAPLLWNTTTSANYSFLYQQVHTHQPYVEELIMLPTNKKMEASRKKAAASLDTAQRAMEVLKTLAPRHAEVVQILARLQLDALHDNTSNSKNNNTHTNESGKKKGDSQPRIPYTVFRQECKAACAVNKDSQLRSFLVELQDHGLLLYDDEWVSIPYDASKLQEFVSYRRPDR